MEQKETKYVVRAKPDTYEQPIIDEYNTLPEAEERFKGLANSDMDIQGEITLEKITKEILMRREAKDI